MGSTLTLYAIAIFISVSISLNIIVTNDDGFGTANVREFYRLLKKQGHDAWLVASVDDQSVQGGRSAFTTSPTLTSPSQYNIIPAGAPSFGTDPNDSHIWYYNGTPAAVTFFALDYVVPRFTKRSKVDLVVSGPNFGNNLGPFLYTLSGTTGATYAAVERGVPAIAFQAGNSTERSYQSIQATTKSGCPDPATIVAQLSVGFVQQLISKSNKKDPLLPFGYGINVKYPTITSLNDDSCVKPFFIQSRFTGGAQIAQAVFNEYSKLFTWGPTTSPGLNSCINGDCNLPGEQAVILSGCYSSVSVFTVDYDAPNCRGAKNIRPLLEPLVKYQHLPRAQSDASILPASSVDPEIQFSG